MEDLVRRLRGIRVRVSRLSPRREGEDGVAAPERHQQAHLPAHRPAHQREHQEGHRPQALRPRETSIQACSRRSFRFSNFLAGRPLVASVWISFRYWDLETRLSRHSVVDLQA